MSTFVDTLTGRAARVREGHWLSARTLEWMALAAIVALAAGLRFANLSALGYANHYYTAAVKSMLQSWHNFFFVAAEPGGSVTVDKPPVGLWLQTASAFIFGVNGFAVLLPEILAGIGSVVVVHHLVRRSFGAAAGLLAALVLAITPVVVATDRNNTIDSILILTLLLAAWAFIKATESRRTRYLLLGALLVGIGFNIKMLQAYLPLPAFYALYFLGSAEGLWRKVGKLALATGLLLVVSLSWAVAVDLTPADQRPYVGSSGDNSELSLIVGYNGLQRLLGMGRSLGGGGSTGAQQAGRQAGAFPWQGNDGAFPQAGQDGNGVSAQPGQDGSGTLPQAAQGSDGTSQWPRQDGTGAFPQQGTNGARGPTGGGPGGFDHGQAGLLRLFSAPLSKEVSWLLPFGLFAVALVALRSRLHWPLSAKHQAAVLWGGWLLTAGVFFSIAGFFHEYYLSMLAPPLAALVGIGVAELWGLRRERPWLAAGLGLAAAGVTLALQLVTAQNFAGSAWWLVIAPALLVVGAVVALASALSRRLQRGALPGLACMVGALLIIPGIWSGLTTAHASANQSLPAAYGGSQGGFNGWGPGGFGRANAQGGMPALPNQSAQPASTSNTSTDTAYPDQLRINQSLLDYLEANTQGEKYLMAVPSSMQGADYVLATGRPVLYMGGFMGQDNVLTVDKLAQLVADGDLRYILWDGGEGGMRGGLQGQSDLTAWITEHGTVIQGFETVTQNSGAPDGTSAGQSTGTTARGGMGGFGQMEVTLYDLQGSA